MKFYDYLLEKGKEDGIEKNVLKYITLIISENSEQAILMW